MWRVLVNRRREVHVAGAGAMIKSKVVIGNEVQAVGYIFEEQ